MIGIPFRGSKRYSYKQVKKIVEENGYKRTLEPFGGSGILSVNLFNDGLINEAVINDYDEIFKIYPEFLDVKDKLVDECLKRGLRKRFYDTRKHKSYLKNEDGSRTYLDRNTLNDDEKRILQEEIAKTDPKFRKLFVAGNSFCQNNLLSENRITLGHFVYFRGNMDSSEAREYLKIIDKCTITNLDYNDFLDTQELDKESLLIVDPPYVGVKNGAYKEYKSFNEAKLNQLFKRLIDLKTDFIFFELNFDHRLENLLNEFNVKPILFEPTGIKSRTAYSVDRDYLVYVKFDPHENEDFFISQN